MMMNLNILNQNPLMFFDRAVNAQRSQLLTVMADAVRSNGRGSEGVITNGSKIYVPEI